MDLSPAIKARMKEVGISVSELSSRTGYSAPYIYGLLGGQKRWNEKTIKKVCSVLGLQMELKATGTYER